MARRCVTFRKIAIAKNRNDYKPCVRQLQPSYLVSTSTSIIRSDSSIKVSDYVLGTQYKPHEAPFDSSLLARQSLLRSMLLLSLPSMRLFLSTSTRIQILQ